ncbi:hypothetical protein HSX10_18535 [Winogradskyella undariae]|uniref:hypothetical protein n=1 Tax=Winogradskyella undariae TaxID=1285465 RepID=UPI00156B76E5|nr:hypothetical protein [Winogradskyella undariae]NRR93572.1 hypothetical protein [Winogradskyella undariae]
MDKKIIGKTFPNLNRTLAYYSPTSLYVTLNEITEEQLADFFTDNKNMNKVKNESIYIHEVRHNIDHFCTLWGQSNILKLSNAINARISNSATEFYKIHPFKKEEYQFHYDEYYTVHYNQVKYNDANDTWAYRLSSGIKFDIKGKPDEKQPILFMNFVNPKGMHVIRVPISIAALLETNSTFDEYQHITEYINSLPSAEKEIENKLFLNRSYRNMLYNQNMAVYNSVVHLTANILGINNLMNALRISSAVATLTLNLTKELISIIPINKLAKEKWKERTKYMIDNKEFGFIFFNLIANYSAEYKKDNLYNLEKLLSTNNLPKEEKCVEIIVKEIDNNKAELSKLACLNESFQDICEIGKEVFHKRGLDGQKKSTKQLLIDNEFLPDVICSNTDFELEDYNLNQVIKNAPTKLPSQQRYSFTDFINQMLDEFYEIRGL